MGFGQLPENGPGEYWKGGIRASIGKVGSGRVPEKWVPSEYWKVGSGRVPKKWDPSKYRKGEIRASTEKVRSG